MKYVIVIPDGCADEPLAELDGKTPLESADTPAMDAIAEQGIVGRANHTPAQLTAGSDVANMSLLGYDPVKNFSGRAPLEAAAIGIQLGPRDWAIRCNLVTIQDQIMRDFTADHISSSEAKALLEVATRKTADLPVEFLPGVSYRNLLLYRGSETAPAPFSAETRATPPHDLTDNLVCDDFPRGPGSGLLSRLMNESFDWFAHHPVNQKRIADGHLPATHLWLWGLGQRPNLESFESKYGVRGAMITAVDLMRGLAALIGWDRIEVPGATGYVDTDYAAKGAGVIQALADYEIVCVHIEAPDEASHEGSLSKKIAAIESIDNDIVRPLLNYFSGGNGWRILITPDHPTFIRTKTHTHGDVPFAMCGTGIEADASSSYGETVAAGSQYVFDLGYQLMPFFIG
jgi:2,3-bisphosphoglycerate-independent phosphoglycerate mutase